MIANTVIDNMSGFDINWSQFDTKVMSLSNDIFKIPEGENNEEMDEKINDLNKSFDSLRELSPHIPCTCVGYLEGYIPCCVDIRSDSKYFTAGFEDSEIHLWSLSVPCITKQRKHGSHIVIDCSQSNLFSLKSEMLGVNEGFSAQNDPAAPCSASNIKNFDCEDDETRADISPSGASILRGHFGPVQDLKFIPNSQLIISCSQDCTARLWDLVIGKNIFVYTGHLYPIWSIDSSPLELYFITGSKDTTARLWSYERLSPVRIFVGHTLSVDIVKFHPNASYVATGSCDKTVSF